MSLQKKTLTPLVLLILFASQVALNAKLEKLEPISIEIPADQPYKADPKWIRILSSGNLPVVIDALVIKALQETSRTQVHSGTHPGSYYDWDLATDLDPAFFNVYPSSANLLTVVRGDAVGARDILLKGEEFYKQELPSFGKEFAEKYWGSKWSLDISLAYVYLFGLEDMPHAAEVFKEAATLPGCPPFLKSLENKLKRPAGEYEVGIRLVNFLIVSAKDDRVKDGLKKKQWNLFVGQFLFELNLAFQKYLASQSGYRTRDTILPTQMQKYWKEFLRASRTSINDPWGGTLSANEKGKVVSTTLHARVFGLD